MLGPEGFYTISLKTKWVKMASQQFNTVSNLLQKCHAMTSPSVWVVLQHLVSWLGLLHVHVSVYESTLPPSLPNQWPPAAPDTVSINNKLWQSNTLSVNDKIAW